MIAICYLLIALFIFWFLKNKVFYWEPAYKRFGIKDFKDLTNSNVLDKNGEWKIARPLNYYGWKWRIQAAYDVWKGKAFPVEWR